jgi:hypothetical protein
MHDIIDLYWCQERWFLFLFFGLSGIGVLLTLINL